MDAQERLNKSLRVALYDGVSAGAMIGLIQDYFTPFLLLLGAAARQIGMLNALPNFFAALIQLKSPDLVVRCKSRKKIVTRFVLLQAFFLLPLGVIALRGGAGPGTVIFFVGLFTASGAIATPAWGSIMSDLVPERSRGGFFGRRSGVIGLVTILAAAASGIILHAAKKINIFSGFAVIFFAAFLFRLLSWYFLKRIDEPPLAHAPESYFTLYNFLARIRESNFAKFVIFVSLMSFSVNLASPFFAVLMLRDLHFSYLRYAVITVAVPITTLLMFGRWGRHADKVGNIRIIRFAAPLIGIIPLLWVIYRGPVYLVFAQIFSGFVWAGFNLCSTNFIYDAVSPEKRTRCIAYFNVLNGIALSAGALLGGAIVQKLPPLFGYKILTLLIISSLLRLAVAFILPRKLREVRPAAPVESRQLFFSVIGLKPLLGIERGTVRY